MTDTNQPMSDNARKAVIAERVFNAVDLGMRALADAGALDAVQVETRMVSDLVTQIRVVTEQAGVHYYTVRVSENW